MSKRSPVQPPPHPLALKIISVLFWGALPVGAWWGLSAVGAIDYPLSLENYAGMMVLFFVLWFILK